MEKNEAINYIIEYLNSLRNEPRVNIDITPPHIEEVASDFGKIYGKQKCTIRIEAEILYTKDKAKMFDSWKKVK